MSAAIAPKSDDQARERWLEERRRYITGTDAPVILGVSGWDSPLSLFARKKGLISEKEETERMRWGTRLQPLVLEAFSEETGRKVTHEPPFSLAKSAAHSFMAASLDGRQVHPEKGPGIVEVKTGGFFKADDWKEEPPVEYQVQVQHQMLVAGVTWGSIAVLIGGQRLLWIDVELNPRFAERLVVQERAFWERLQRNDPPDPDASAATRDALRALFPQDTGSTVGLPPEAIEIAAELDQLKAAEKEAGARITALENQIKAWMGDATFGLAPDGTRWQWKASARAGYVVQATTVRSLKRLKK